MTYILFQFVCIAQQDYCRILNQVEKNMQKVEEEGEIVMVKEHRELDRTGTRKGHIVIKVRQTCLHPVGRGRLSVMTILDSPHPIFMHNFSLKVTSCKKSLYFLINSSFNY